MGMNSWPNTSDSYLGESHPLVNPLPSQRPGTRVRDLWSSCAFLGGQSLIPVSPGRRGFNLLRESVGFSFPASVISFPLQH